MNLPILVCVEKLV